MRDRKGLLFGLAGRWPITRRNHRIRNEGPADGFNGHASGRLRQDRRGLRISAAWIATSRSETVIRSRIRSLRRGRTAKSGRPSYDRSNRGHIARAAPGP